VTPEVFQMVGAGANYLAANSPYRNAGTTNIDPTLLAALSKRPLIRRWFIPTSRFPYPQRLILKPSGTPTHPTSGITMTRLTIWSAT